MALDQQQKEKLESLNPDQIMVLQRVALGYEDSKINDKLDLRGGLTAQSVLLSIYDTLGLNSHDNLTERRELAAQMFREHGEAIEAAKTKSKLQQPLSSAKTETPTLPQTAPIVSTSETSCNTRGVVHVKSATDIVQVAAKLARASRRLKLVARCIANDLDIDRELGIAKSSVPGYVSNLYGELDLPLSLGKMERRRIVSEAFRNLQATSTQTTPATEEPEETGPASQEGDVPEILPSQPSSQPPVHSSEVAEGNGSCPTHDEPAPAPIPRQSRGNEQDQVAAANLHYGPGVAVVLADPSTIIDIEVISGEHQSGVIASHIVRCKRSGFLPEVVIVYPTADPNVTLNQLIFVKRQR